jgi:hypothetical protein
MGTYTNADELAQSQWHPAAKGERDGKLVIVYAQ